MYTEKEAEPVERRTRCTGSVKRAGSGCGRFFGSAGVCMLLSELWKQYTLNVKLCTAGAGRYNFWYFPFQLCSVPMYVCLLLCLCAAAEKRKKNTEALSSACLTYLATYGLLSGIMAFCDTSGFRETGFWPLTFHSYAWHVLLILLGIRAATALLRREPLIPGGQKISGNASGAFLIYLFGCGIAELWNALFSKAGSINMFYINPRLPMNQVCFREIGTYLSASFGPRSLISGNGAAILSYIAATVTGAMIFSILLLYLESRRNSSSEET